MSDRSNHLLKCTSCQGNSEFCIERLSNCKRPFWIMEIRVLPKLLFFSLERDRGSFVGEFVKMTPQVRSCGHMLSEALKHLFPQIGGKVKKNRSYHLSRDSVAKLNGCDVRGGCFTLLEINVLRQTCWSSPFPKNMIEDVGG